MISDYRDILKARCNWLIPSKTDGICVATRARLARNLSGFQFGAKGSPQSRGMVEELLLRCIEESETQFKWYIPLAPLPLMVLNALEERKLSSSIEELPPLGMNVAVSESLDTMALINFQDHLWMSCTVPGNTIDEAYSRVDALETEVGKKVEFAYDEEFGFLTSGFGQMGTGLRISVIVHLPALGITENIEKAISGITDAGFLFRDFFTGEESDEAPGHLYTVSNRATLGISEAEICSKLSKIIPFLQNYEDKAVDKVMSAEKKTFFEDIVGRSLGLLENARMLSYGELMDSLSALHLASKTGMQTRGEGRLLYDLIFDAQSNNIQLSNGREMSSEERREKRAQLVQERISNL